MKTRVRKQKRKRKEGGKERLTYKEAKQQKPCFSPDRQPFRTITDKWPSKSTLLAQLPFLNGRRDSYVKKKCRNAYISVINNHTALYCWESKPKPSIHFHLFIPLMNSYPETMRHPTNSLIRERTPFWKPSSGVQAPGCSPWHVLCAANLRTAKQLLQGKVTISLHMLWWYPRSYKSMFEKKQVLQESGWMCVSSLSLKSLKILSLLDGNSPLVSLPNARTHHSFYV